MQVLDVEDFSRIFAEQRWVLWLGAGVSLAEPTRIPLASGISRGLVGALASTSEAAATNQMESALRRISDRFDQVPFEAVLGQIALHTRDLALEVMRGVLPMGSAVKPNANHRLAARLLMQGNVDLIVTTNFDEAIDGLVPGVPRVLLSPEVEPPPITGRALVKLHGTISNAGSLAISPDALQARADSAVWRSRVFELLRGRHVLFVGYGLTDYFDIVPAIVEAGKSGAHLFVGVHEKAPRLKPAVTRLGEWLDVVYRHDLERLSRNVLAIGARSVGLLKSTDVLGPSMNSMEQVRFAFESTQRAIADHRVTTTERLRAIGALSFWLDDGESALRLFERAGISSRSAADLELLASALARAGRYRAAVRVFERLMALGEQSLGEQGAEDQATTHARMIHWSVGAGYCSANGGRLRLANRFFRRADLESQMSGVQPRALDPYLADQYLRGRAGHETHIVLSVRSSTLRQRHLRRANAFLDELASMSLPLRLRPLLAIAQARVANAAGMRSRAVERLRWAKEQIDLWGDDLEIVVVERRLAAAGQLNRRRVRYLIQRAWRTRQWMTLFKMCATYVGWHGYESGPLMSAARNWLLFAWDVGKDLLLRPVQYSDP